MFLLIIIGTKEQQTAGRFDLNDMRSAAVTGMTSIVVCATFFVTDTKGLFLTTFTAATIMGTLCEIACGVAETIDRQRKKAEAEAKAKAEAEAAKKAKEKAEKKKEEDAARAAKKAAEPAAA